MVLMNAGESPFNSPFSRTILKQPHDASAYPKEQAEWQEKQFRHPKQKLDNIPFIIWIVFLFSFSPSFAQRQLSFSFQLNLVVLIITQRRTNFVI